MERYRTESGQGDGQGDVEKEDRQTYRQLYMVGKAIGKKKIDNNFVEQLDKLNTYLSISTRFPEETSSATTCSVSSHVCVCSIEGAASLLRSSPGRLASPCAHSSSVSIALSASSCVGIEANGATV